MFLEVDLREEEESNWGSQKALGFRFLVPGDTHDFFRVPVIRRLAQPLAPMNFACMLNIQISSTWIIFVFITLSPWLLFAPGSCCLRGCPGNPCMVGLKPFL
jgi:hypothetical protein